MMAQNPNQQGSGADPASPTKFCSFEFIVEKTTPRLACGNGCLRKDGLKLGWLRGKLAEVKAKVVFVQRKSGVGEIKVT